jgi:hypothetical protein
VVRGVKSVEGVVRGAKSVEGVEDVEGVVGVVYVEEGMVSALLLSLDLFFLLSFSAGLLKFKRINTFFPSYPITSHLFFYSFILLFFYSSILLFFYSSFPSIPTSLLTGEVS